MYDTHFTTTARNDKHSNLVQLAHTGWALRQKSQHRMQEGMDKTLRTNAIVSQPMLCTLSSAPCTGNHRLLVIEPPNNAQATKGSEGLSTIVSPNFYKTQARTANRMPHGASRLSVFYYAPCSFFRLSHVKPSGVQKQFDPVRGRMTNQPEKTNL